MPYTNSPNMNLPVPTVSQEPGPAFAQDVNQALQQIDQHNHTSGQGVPIPSQGLNITTDLSFNVSNATALRSTRFVSTTASSGTDVGCLYVKGVDLFYNDLAGNVIPVTRNGALASTAVFSGQISTTAIVSANGAGAPASSGFIRMVNNADKINWRNAANNADDSFYVDGSDKFHLVGPAYDYAFPNTLPTSTLPLSVSTAGAISFGLITRPQLPNVGIQSSSSPSGLFQTNSSTPIDIPGWSFTLTTTGRPVMVGVTSDGTGSLGGSGFLFNISGGGLGGIIILRNATPVYVQGPTGGVGGVQFGFPIIGMDIVPPSSTYTYKAQLFGDTANTAQLNKARFFAFEL